MSTTTVSITCPVCLSEWHAQPAPARIAPCPSCGLPTTVPPPARDVFSDELFFDGAYAGQRLKGRPQWLHEAERRLDWVQSHVASGRLLEIGSATGEFVAVAERAGFDVTGLEASAWAAEAAHDLTQRVVRADHRVWLRQERRAFDAIAFFHTLEHVHDPHAFLQPLVDALASDGLVFVEVPNGEARDAKDGEDWLGSRLSDHVAHYREKDLRKLLGDAGLSVRSASTVTMREFDSPLVWALRKLRWISKGRFTPSHDFLRVVAARA